MTERMNKLMNEQMNEWMNEWMNKWLNGEKADRSKDAVWHMYGRLCHDERINEWFDWIVDS